MDTPDEVETKRLRTLTVRAMENYKEKVKAYHAKLLEKRQAVEASLAYLEEQTGDIQILGQVRETLVEVLNHYYELCKEFCEYLSPQNTEQSNSELLVQKSVFQTIAKEVDLAIKFIDEQTSHSTKIETENSSTAHLVKEDEPQLTIRKESPVHHSSLHGSLHDQGNSSHKIQGHKSHSSSSHKAKGSDGGRSSNYTHSHSSQGSRSSKSIPLDKTARAEAAKAKLKFIEEEEKLVRKQNELELEVQKQRSELKSNLNILKHKREIAEAEAELTAVKENLDEENAIDSNWKDRGLNLPESSASEIVKSYVTNQRPKVYEPVEATKLNPRIPEFVPSTILQREFKTFQPQQNVHLSESPGIIDLTKYIMKKDLLISRLSTFDDKPERYCSWKNSFNNILRELDATDSEQLDLLNRYLGPQSKRHAASLRVANSHNENQAVVKIWQRLDERYGAPESIAAALKDRLDKFNKINNTEYDKLYELYDLLAEVESIKENDIYRTVLSFYDSSYGVNAIVGKLPNFIQTKWMDRASRYKTQHSVMYPPFSTFVEFLHSMAVRMNDPSLKIQQSDSGRDKKVERKYAGKRTPGQTVLKTTIEKQNTSANLNLKCIIHENGKHNLADCKVFVEKPLEEKRQLIRKNGICFKCLNGKHLAKDCKANIKCEKCGKTAHCTAFHFERETLQNNGGERQIDNIPQDQVSTKCTEICKDSGETTFQGKSCAKTLLVKVYPEGKPEVSVTTYAIIDDQSNRSLACSTFIDYFNETTEPVEYSLASCSGKTVQHGRRTTGYILESLDGTTQLKCPSLIECNEIPISKREIATPAIARHYKHLQDIEQFIPELDRNAEVMLLIGRDVTAAHHILDQRIGKDNEPYAQRLRLGWAIIGETCLGLVHTSDTITVNKTTVLPNGRETNLKPCEYGFRVKDKEPDIGSTVFKQTREDDTLGLSQEDKEFLIVMDKEFHTSENGRLSAPLPFRRDRPKLQNNYHQARQRAENLSRSFKRDSTKQQHFVEFMKKIFVNNHAEAVTPARKGEEVWYLPIFGVYHAKKQSKIRVVFDSAAKYNGLCLNDILMKGPDLTNNLVGVLLKFRKGKVAAIADVEQMFFNFEVNEEHRNYLRFVWFKDNTVTEPLTEYRMKVHVFGNSPSPAVANYGLRKAVCDHTDLDTCDDVCHYVNNNFYVDDGLVSGDSPEEIVSLIKRTQERLITGGKIRLHKIVSNNSEVVKSFETKDLAESITEIDFNSESTCLQRSLGLCWNVVKDIFTYQLSKEEKPFTKRGLLSVINGIFDPLGFIAPVILGGRLIMREAVQNNSLDWDDPLPDDLLSDWQRWKQSLQDLETLEIGRPFTSQSLNDSTEYTFHKSECTSFDIVSPDEDQEVCPIAVESMKTLISPIQTLGVDRFERFSKWSSLVRAISLLKRKIVSSYRSKVDTKDTRTCVDIRKEAETLVLRETQLQYYSNETDCLKSANQFWKQWNLQYLHNLQTRSKWPSENRNLQIGDFVPMIDVSLPHNQWPTGIIDEVFPSKDGLVRKVSVRVIKNGEPVTYSRPVTQLVHLMSD
ncbi:unnamed protein product [Mytilus edulis]|uniref:DUF5641 domain-containing protein n=1 Tax=Mytilus edulis TaxID=6550 RepID=A0A8S3TB64_MYTED|nr:unnamed protein product [Mytilus edulis]